MASHTHTRTHRMDGAACSVQCAPPSAARALLPALYGLGVPVYPPGRPPHPRSVTGDNFAFLVFLPCTHRACGSSSYPKSSCSAPEAPNPPKSQPRGTDLPIIYQLTLAIHHHSTLSLVAPWPCSLLFASSFFPSSNHPPRNHQQTVDRLATGPTSQPKHRMSGSHNTQHHHHPPLCQS